MLQRLLVRLEPLAAAGEATTAAAAASDGTATMNLPFARDSTGAFSVSLSSVTVVSFEHYRCVARFVDANWHKRPSNEDHHNMVLRSEIRNLTPNSHLNEKAAAQR